MFTDDEEEILPDEVEPDILQQRREERLLKSPAHCSHCGQPVEGEGIHCYFCGELIFEDSGLLGFLAKHSKNPFVGIIVLVLVLALLIWSSI